MGIYALIVLLTVLVTTLITQLKINDQYKAALFAFVLYMGLFAGMATLLIPLGL